ncbi:MAG: DNA replication and repair protein RecF, partial [Gammaproteobacteria bacterium]|nr:DNA replication and repair protein RecF [Gammaproteobacteria bacterium]
VATLVDQARQGYFSRFVPIFQDVVRKIAEIGDISLNYRRGWDAERDLLQVLVSTENQDLKYGTTQAGPHRADIVVKLEGVPASDVLSRGQQKMLVSALKLAQGVIQAENTERTCIFLVDDLPAELDEGNRKRICCYLQEMHTQVFLTCVDHSSLRNSLDWSTGVTKFHVEHGKIID